jgi:maleamate amidohydrolase
MSEPIWNQFLTERDKQVFAASGYGSRQGFGKRPAVLVVDVNYDFCGDRPEPILESIKRWRNSCGAEAWEGVAAIKRLLAAARSTQLPIIYTTSGRRADNWDQGSWAWKNTRTAERVIARDTQLPGNTIVPDIAPQRQDIVLYKQKPSAFYATPLLSYLVLLNADSIILTGVSTSGRASANLAGHTVVMWVAKQNPQLKPTYTHSTGLVWAIAFRPDDQAGRAEVSMAIKCMKQDGTLARLYEKWFGEAPAADSWTRKIAPGHGVPDLPGYDATPVTLKCS